MDKLKFSSSFLYKTGERIIPGSVSESVISEHYSRYDFASEFCMDKKVLNVASGCGYGSEVLMKSAVETFNVDISENLVAYGNNKYGSYRNHFLKMDAQNLQFPDKFFDAIVSFETFEHLPDYRKFLDECHRVLKDDGILIVSTPNKIITSPGLDNPINRFHFKEWKFKELNSELHNFFNINGVYGQHFTKPMVVSGTKIDKNKRAITYFCYNFIPAFIFKLIKKYYLRYREIPANNVVIHEKDRVKKANEIDFDLNNDKYAYAVIIFVLNKK